MYVWRHRDLNISKVRQKSASQSDSRIFLNRNSPWLCVTGLHSPVGPALDIAGLALPSLSEVQRGPQELFSAGHMRI